MDPESKIREAIEAVKGAKEDVKAALATDGHDGLAWDAQREFDECVSSLQLAHQSFVHLASKYGL